MTVSADDSPGVLISILGDSSTEARAQKLHQERRSEWWWYSRLGRLGLSPVDLVPLGSTKSPKGRLKSLIGGPDLSGAITDPQCSPLAIQ